MDIWLSNNDSFISISCGWFDTCPCLWRNIESHSLNVSLFEVSKNQLVINFLPIGERILDLLIKKGLLELAHNYKVMS